MTPPEHPNRGDVCEVNLDPIVGHEQRGRAGPCMVLSVDSLNAARWVLVVVPTTSQLRPSNKGSRPSRTSSASGFGPLMPGVRAADLGVWNMARSKP